MKKFFSDMIGSIKILVQDVCEKGPIKGFSRWYFKRNHYWPPVYENVPVAEPAPNDPLMLIRKRPKKKFRMPSRFSIWLHYYWILLTKPNAL